MNNETKPKYRIYPTLLDAYTRYIQCDRLYNRLYGMSGMPEMDYDSFSAQQRQELIDRINRVPFDSVAADRGTVFNELVDCLVESRRPMEGLTVEKYRSANYEVLRASYKGREFLIPRHVVQTFATKYPGALTQVRVSAMLVTSYGPVELYGLIDELMPASVHDIKTTSHYTVGKYKDHAQHLVYPYCLEQLGSPVTRFDYDVAEFSDRGQVTGIYSETYMYNHERDVPVLRDLCEEFIRFLEENRELITDRKIFGEA